jgi:hypothetical protein
MTDNDETGPTETPDATTIGQARTTGHDPTTTQNPCPVRKTAKNA